MTAQNASAAPSKMATTSIEACETLNASDIERGAHVQIASGDERIWMLSATYMFRRPNGGHVVRLDADGLPLNVAPANVRLVR